MAHDGRNQAQSYWASCETEKMPTELYERVKTYLQYLTQSGRMDSIQRARRAHFGLDENGGWKRSDQVTFAGEQGEVTQIKVNHFRALVKNLLTLCTGDRPAYSARAINGDPESMRQAQLAEDIVDYYNSEKRIEDVYRRVAEIAIVDTEGWLHMPWDVHEGDEYGIDEQPVYGEDGEPLMERVEAEAVDGEEAVELTEERPVMEPHVIRQGDIRAEALSMVDVARPVPLANGDLEPQWVILRRLENRWDLAARYPELAKQIRDAEVPSSESRIWDRSWSQGGYTRDSREDMVEMLEFYHDISPSMPDGRHTIVVADSVLHDGALPYKRVPVFGMAPGIEWESGVGYSSALDLLSLQQALDSTVTAALTNHEAFGVQKLTAPKGSDVTPHELSQYLTLVEYTPIAGASGGGKPERLDLLKIGPETFQLMEYFTAQMGMLLGINEAARGKMDGVRSGAHAALLVQQAIRFNSDFERAWVRLLERAGTCLLEHLQAFATTPRMLQIAGRHKRPVLRTFQSDAIRNVRRVAVDLGSPMERNPAGRFQMAEMLLQQDKIDVQRFFEIIETGRIEPIYDADQSLPALLREENSSLVQGQQVPTYALDDHPTHIREHLAAFANPEVRANDQIAQVVHDHIFGHLQHWQTMSAENPTALAAAGIPPLPQPPGPGGDAGGMPPDGPPGPMPPGGDPMGAPGHGAPPPGPGGPPRGPSVGGPPSVAQQADGGPRMPSLPQTPAGEPVTI
jgi:hypothetical protein